MTPAVVTVDVEPDNVWANPFSTSMQNISSLPNFHAICGEFKIRPTYLVTYSVANHSGSVRTIEQLLATGSCEIGAHPHYWETPPHHPLDLSGAIVGNAYDEPTLSEKLHRLTSLLKSRFGSPVSHRSGRWGFDDRQANLLSSHGYLVDSSVTPGLDWGVTGAPDYSQAPLGPYWLQDSLPRAILEVPCTIQPAHKAWRAGGRNAKRVLGRLGLGPRWLRCAPSMRFRTLKSVSEWAVRMQRPLVLMTHSSELAVGCSPMWRTPQAIATHFDLYRQLFAVWTRIGVSPMTLAEFAASWPSERSG